MTPMSETQPAPGQVIGEDDVAKLRAGDVLRLHAPAGPSNKMGDLFTFADHLDPTPTRVRLIDADGKGPAAWHCSRFTFIGRPGPDGFIPWTGGENPVPGQRVEVRLRDGTHSHPLPSDTWTVSWRNHGGPSDIIAFRLSPPAGPPPSSKTEHVAGDAVSGAVERQGEVPFYAVKHAISVAMQDAKNGHPCGCIVEAGCEARGYVDPDYAAAQFIWEAAEKAVLAMLGHPRQEQPASAETADAAQTAEIADLKARNKALEGEAERLKLAICGGEDVPGVAASCTVEQCEAMLREERARNDWSFEREEAWRARIKALQNAVRPLAGGKVRSLSDEDDIPDSAIGSVTVTMGDIRRARTLTEADHGR